jgi:hypothetical protein
MFAKLAKFRPVQVRRAAPHWAQPANQVHCNDNRRGVRRPASPGRTATTLVCHWVRINGRLECRWTIAPAGDHAREITPQSCATTRVLEPPPPPAITLRAT